MTPHRSTVRTSAVQLESGLTLAYVEHGEPAGEPIAFLHGITDSSFSFSRVLPLLDPTRYHLLALDLRGHGDSDRPEAGYAMDDLAGDVGGFLDALGIARASLVGHSMGSAVARRFAETSPQRVDRLVLIDSSFTYDVEILTGDFRAAVQELTDPVSEAFAREFQVSTGHLPIPDAFLDRAVAESLKLPARVWRAALDGLIGFDDAADLGSIEAPTLVMWGEADPYFGWELQEPLLAAIPDARLLVYPDTGHNPHWERPESVAYDLAAFLSSTVTASAR